MRSSYWNNSKFANWLRGVKKPEAASIQGWIDWKKQSKEFSKVRYWLAEEGLNILQTIFYWPQEQFSKIRYYINNRWITRTHALTAHPRDIKPGEWHDLGNRFLPCLFNELVKFVEVECAWHHCIWDEDAKKQFQVPWYRSWGWRTWRSPESGIAYLKWSSETTHGHQLTDQAIAAREILELYTWWTETRPNRLDPYVDSGWSAVLQKERELGDGELFWDGPSDPDLAREREMAHARLMKLEEYYQKEDDEMLVRLVKIRHHLWT